MSTPFSMYEVGSQALLPPPDISVSDWADENVIVTGSGSAERGQWHTRRFQREPMAGRPDRGVPPRRAPEDGEGENGRRLPRVPISLNCVGLGAGLVGGFERGADAPHSQVVKVEHVRLASIERFDAQVGFRDLIDGGLHLGCAWGRHCLSPFRGGGYRLLASSSAATM